MTDITPVINFINRALISNRNYDELQNQFDVLKEKYQADEVQLQQLLSLIANCPPQLLSPPPQSDTSQSINTSSQSLPDAASSAPASTEKASTTEQGQTQSTTSS